MTLYTLDELLTPLTVDDCKARLIARMKAKGLPVDDWEEGGVFKTIIEMEAQQNADLSARQVSIAKAACAGTSGGPWLDLVGNKFFCEARKAAQYSQRVLRLTAVAAAGPYTIVPRQLWASDPILGLRWQNITGGTLAKGGTLELTFQAESAGASYNVPPGNVSLLMTPLSGVSMADVDPGDHPGVDEESDASYWQRCQDKWSLLGYGQNAAWFRYQALSGYAESSSVTRCKVATDPTGTGEVTVVLAGPAGAVGPSIVAACQANFDAKRCNGSRTTVVSATAVPVTISGLSYVKAAYAATYRAKLEASLGGMFASLGIDEGLSQGLITKYAIVDGMTDFELASPSNDLTVLPNQILIFGGFIETGPTLT